MRGLFIYGGVSPVFPMSVTHVVISKSVTTVKPRSFEHCQFLVSLIMHDEVESIESYAFIDCPRLEYVRVSKKLRYLGKYAFNCCSGLQYLFLPKTLTTVGRKVFWFCESLEFLVLPEEADIREHTSEDFDETGIFLNIARPMGIDYTYCRVRPFNRQFARNEWVPDGETPSNRRSSRSLNRWFLTYMNEYPLHKMCTDPSVSGNEISEYLSSEDASDATVIDRFHGMTALHILAMNPHTPPGPVAALFHFNKEAIFILDRHSKTPIDLARKFNVENMLGLINCLCILRERG